jgi:cupin 2 domain-containing protein
MIPLPTAKEERMNFYDALPGVKTGEERFQTLLEHNCLTIERIVSNRLDNGEWYDQDHDEWVLLAEGEALLSFTDGGVRALRKGDYLFIPAHRRHKVVSTSANALWLALHLHAPSGA